MLYTAARPLLFRLDAERAHNLSLAALARMPAWGHAPAPAGPLTMRIAGLDFPGPVGLAAGYDKDARVPAQLLALGFGFVEVGTLTPRPQAGNPRPRLFRLVADRAVINRMGFNNAGQAAAHDRLARLIRRAGPVGVNIGANKDSVDRIADYAAGAARMADVADYLTINVSSPNTPGLRALQDGDALAALLAGVNDALVPAPRRPPVFLKVAPDLNHREVDAIVRAAHTADLGAIIVANTTLARPPLRARYRDEAGGLSGAPLAPVARAALDAFRAAAGGTMPLIAAGGIATAEEAWARIRAGASLVQLYSAMVYEGPGLARRMTEGVSRLMVRDGFERLADAVGSGA